MKILKKIIALIIIVLMTLTNTAKADIFSSSSFNTNNKNIVRAAVLLYSFDDLFMLQIKQNLEAIERENKDKIRFTFYDGKK
jgi:methyl-galactoside transport system substrate-binding protein